MSSVKYRCHACPSIVIRLSSPSIFERDTPLPGLPSTRFFVVADKFDFDNIGVSRAHEGQVYLCCADCDTLLGYVDEERYYLATDLIKLFPLVKERWLEAATPLLRQRMSMLIDSDAWHNQLTWNSAEKRELGIRLRESATSCLQSEQLHGYLYIDKETIRAIKCIFLVDDGQPYWLEMELCIDSVTYAFAWRVHGLRLPYEGCDLLTSMEALQAHVAALRTQKRPDPADDDGDYWGQYDADSADEAQPASKAASDHTQEREQDYYNRYEEVETAIPAEQQQESQQADAEADAEARLDTTQRAILRHCAASLSSLRSLCEGSGIPVSALSRLAEGVLSAE